MHKQKGKYFSAGGMGQGKFTSAGGMGQQKFFFWRLHGEAGTWNQGTSWGQDIRCWLRAGTICGCSWSSVSVAHFWPTFLLRGRGPIQRSGQLCCLNGSQQEINLPEDPAIPLLGLYQNDAPPCYRDTCSTMFLAALFVITRSWKQPRCPTTEEWIQKMPFIYRMEYYSAIRIEDIMSFACKWIEQKGIILSEVNQTQKNMHGMYSLISGLLAKKKSTENPSKI